MAGLLDFIGGVGDAIGRGRARIQEPAVQMRARILEEAQKAQDERLRKQQLADATNAGVGLAKQLNRSGLTGDPTAQTAVGLMQDPGSRALGVQMAADLLDPAKQQALTNARLSGQATQQGMGFAANQDARAQTSLQLDQARTAAYIANMNYDAANKATAQQLAALQGALKSEGDLRAEYQKAPTMVKGVQAVGSWQMLKRALDQNNEMALQSAIVAAAQIQEPGLAVRNDDRIAYSGSNPVVDRLVQTFNTAMSGEGLTPGVKQRLLALGTQMAGVHAQNIQQVTEEYRKLAINTPGARMDQVTSGTGVDWDTVNFLAEMTRPRSDGPVGPRGR